MRKLIVAAAAFALLATSSGVRAADTALQPINISYQPTNYWVLPIYVASQKGWWKDVGLDPKFSTFPAGAPQVAAAASKSWDVGAAGSPPAVLGAARYNIITIGISNDESASNVMMARADKIADLKKNPQQIKGQQVMFTANSTGEYVVNSCLRKMGLSESDIAPVNLGQAQILSAFSGGTGNLVGVWAPNSYTLEEKSNAALLCSGKDAGVYVPGAIIARSEFAKEHPEAVAKFLAVYERGVKWEMAHPAEAQKMLIEADKEGGTEISARGAKAEMTTRPIFDLAAQLKLMDRGSSGTSNLDKWMNGIVAFMKSKGSITESPDPKVFVTDEYMKMVDKDAKLKSFANNKK